MVNSMNDIEIIKCPICGREYLPVEIFVPNAFFGEPDVVKRDTEGNIIGYIGKGPDTTEKYVCDTCNKPFKVSTSIKFITEIDDDADFTSEFKSRSNVKYTLDEF